ncbi:Wzz/FepE/Etk N-terminal domain-containing protein [Cellulosilyticum sp. I15G10I2]|uniref:Wzz/FepE/Etk N-terminal domain-containing protein n=1 Tax=Cellulosilyticum sp. I15G10I2 TaxID=1892843 RepID=UPI00085CD8CA|nr:Wzz/FepE/Etk N-terminal domain-containing protein [Cellulosilyticum sp. I15G10I2]
MSENELNVQHYEDEIDLRELILTLWKQKHVIISTTLIATILAGLFSVFILSPVYDTRLNIVINMPEIYNTRYGEYKLPITTNEQYINLIKSNDVLINTISQMGYKASEVSVDDLRKKIAIGQVTAKADAVQNSFDITVSASTPQESLKLAQTLYDNYIEFLNVMTKERAVGYYYNNFNVELKKMQISLKSNQELLKKNEELLAQIPQTIDQKEAIKEIASGSANTSHFVVLENIINPNYTKVENDIILNKQTINGIEDSIRMHNEYLAELDSEKQAITKYYEDGKIGQLESSLIGVVKTSVYLPSPPVAPTQKTSPRNALNVAIGIVLGGMLGVMIVFVREWFKKD